MRGWLISGLSVTALVVGLSLSAAQQPQQQPQRTENLSSPQQKQEQEKAQHTEEGRAGTTEPSSETPTPQNTAAFVNGRLAAPGAPADSQTVPAKFSKRNAALDALPTMAFPVALTDEQKRRIMDAVGKAHAQVAAVTLHPADQMPSSVPLSELPQGLAKEIPVVAGYQYVRTQDGILLVRAPTMTVVGELAN